MCVCACVCHTRMPQYMVCMCVCMHAPCAYATVYRRCVCVCMYAQACMCHACMPQYMEGVCEGVCIREHVYVSCAYAQVLEWKKGELVSNASPASFLQSATLNPILLFLSYGGGQHFFRCFFFFSCVCWVFFFF